MAQRRGSVRVLTVFTKTVKAITDTPLAEAYPKNWDRRAGAEQQIDRVKTRLAMGSKMTPIGQGVAVRTKE